VGELEIDSGSWAAVKAGTCGPICQKGAPARCLQNKCPSIKIISITKIDL
jgi:hypothetical protein